MFSLWDYITATVVEWRRRMRQRSELMMLSAPELRDMMLTEADIDAQASKSFWQSIDIPARE